MSFNAYTIYRRETVELCYELYIPVVNKQQTLSFRVKTLQEYSQHNLKISEVKE